MLTSSLKCYRAATDVVRVFIDELSAQKEYIRHGPEAQCVFVTFASAFLIKVGIIFLCITEASHFFLVFYVALTS